MSCDLKSGLAANTGGAALDENEGHKVLRLKAELAQQRSPSRRLCCSELNRVVTFVSENESD
jgi:hypothetical protein